MAFSFATVEITLENPDGSAAVGDITLTPESDISNGLVTIVARPLTMALNDAGYASAQVVSTQDPGTFPPNVMYRVDERVFDSPINTYFVPVASGGVVVDLAQLRPGAAVG